MSLGDIFKAKENETLKSRIAELEGMLTPEMRDSMQLQEKINYQEKLLTSLQADCAKTQADQTALLDKSKSELSAIEDQIRQARSDLVETEDTVLLQSFGLYQPHYSFSNATGYKEALDNIRAQQKDSVKKGSAATGNKDWTVNGDRRKGAKMISDMQKLLLRAFNTECDDVIDHVKFSNIDAAEKRIQTAFSTISKLGSVCGVAITGSYRNLKLEELHLAYEYQIEKQKEKDRLKELRAEERERAKLEQEIEAERKKLEKEQQHYANALQQIIQQIATADPADLSALEEKKAELEAKANDIDCAIKKVDYRAANQKAGYVYIISNIGSFGENVYKIGMTRRLDPMDRINELGDASVPFKFDVHAIIFSDDAPKLEAALHNAFDDRKVNMVNGRKEFFNVQLDEIEQVVKQNYEKTVDFHRNIDAEEFRETQMLRKQMN